MDLLQLRYFYESAKTENFAKTAAKYMVPTSSVSASVKRLEKEVGCPLFDRSSNRIVLNDSGKKFMQSLGTIFDELDQAVDALSSPSNTDTRDIRIAAFALRNIITDSIIEYQQKYPQTSFKISLGAIDDVRNFDIIIDEKYKAYEDFEEFELCSARMMLKVSKNSPLYGKKLTMNQLRNQSFITMGEQGNLHKLLLASCKKAGFVPNVVAQSNDARCYWDFVKAGIGIGVGRCIRYSSSNPEIGTLNVSDFNERQVVCCYFKRHTDYGNVKHFLNFLKSKDFQSKFF